VAKQGSASCDQTQFIHMENERVQIVCRTDAATVTTDNAGAAETLIHGTAGHAT